MIARATWAAPGLDALAAALRARTGLTLEPGRALDVERRVEALAARLGLEGPAALADRLDAPGTLDALVDEVVVGETWFLRDAAQVEAAIAAAVRAREAPVTPAAPLRVWSAGCASGEEPYSLALLLDEAGLGDRSAVLASDLSPAAIARARAAVYRDWSFRGVPPGRLDGRFVLTPRGRALDPALARRVTFFQHNLVAGEAPLAASGLDLVFCRNVLIHLDPSRFAAVAATLFGALAPGGWLALAPSDPLLAEFAPFELVSTAAGLLHRRPAPAALAAPPAPREGARRVREVAGAGGTSCGEREAADASCGEREAADAAGRWPLDPGLHVLHGLRALEAGAAAEAVAAFRRALYLDPALAVAHHHLGVALARAGEGAGARRALAHAATLLAALPPASPAPHGEGELAGRLLEASRFLLARLEPGPGGPA